MTNSVECSTDLSGKEFGKMWELAQERVKVIQEQEQEQKKEAATAKTVNAVAQAMRQARVVPPLPKKRGWDVR